MSGIADSLARSQANIDSIAGRVQDYYKRKKAEEDTQSLYGALNQYQSPQTTQDVLSPNNFNPPSQSATGLNRGQSNVINQPLALPNTQPPQATSRMDALKMYLENNPSALQNSAFPQMLATEKEISGIGDQEQQRLLRDAQIANEQSLIAERGQEDIVIPDPASPDRVRFGHVKKGQPIPTGAMPLTTYNQQQARSTPRATEKYFYVPDKTQPNGYALKSFRENEVLPNGALLPETFNAQVARDNKPEKTVDYESKGMTDKGWTVGYDKKTNMMKATNAQGATEPYDQNKHGVIPKGAGGGITDTANYDLSGEDFLKSGVPKKFWNVVREKASGHFDKGELSGFGGGAATKNQVAIWASQYSNGGYNSSLYPNYEKTIKDYTTGGNAAKVNSFNIATSHIEAMAEAAYALKTGNVQILNKLANEYKTQTGKDAVPVFESVSNAIASEIASLLKSSVGRASATDPEIANVLKTISPNMSPEQIQGVVKEYLRIMKPRFEELERNYANGTGNPDFKKRYVSPKVNQVFSSYGIQFDSPFGGDTSPGTQIQPTAVPQSQPTPVQQTPSTNAKGWILHQDASGNKAYVSPDGKQFEEVK